MNNATQTIYDILTNTPAGSFSALIEIKTPINICGQTTYASTSKYLSNKCKSINFNKISSTLEFTLDNDEIKRFKIINVKEFIETDHGFTVIISELIDVTPSKISDYSCEDIKVEIEITTQITVSVRK